MPDSEQPPLSDPSNAGNDLHYEQIDLDKIPRRLWEQTLAPLHRQERIWIARQVSDERRRDAAMELATELDFADGDRRRARDEARFAARRMSWTLPVAGPDHASARPTVQVNIRLRRDDHERLRQAAATAGMRPTTLARALVLNGVAKILQENAGRIGSPPNARLSLTE
jgi:hypothetical protein